MQVLNRRRFLLGAGTMAAGLAAASGPMAEGGPMRLPGETGNSDANAGSASGAALLSFIHEYMRQMYAPGMIVAQVHADGRTSAAAYGLSDVARNLPVTTEMLFQIGSISKSFCALALLQMRDEGKLELNRPVLEYLPWLPIEEPYGTIAVHHLLTHTSGLPDNPPLFLSDRNARHVQGYKPGTQFHYCNLAFEILGRLAATIDRKSYAAVLQTRLLDPLGMKATYPAISNAIRDREAQSYVFYRDDLSGTRSARLEVAPRAVFDGAAGCIASTAEDMARYITMLTKKGIGPAGRIVSEESFELFATPYIEAEEFGKGARYGYGIAVDTLDGHKLLRHTGGMDSFASSLQVDLDAKVGAFASINAMQGYRPNPVTKYAIQAMRAEAEGKPLPKPDDIDDPKSIANADEYAGAFSGDAGELRVIAEGKGLAILRGTERIRLQHAEGDRFVAEDEAWQMFAWVFGRGPAPDSGKNGPVTELMFGPDWYVNAAYKGPKSIAAPARLAAFEGVYDSGTDCLRVVICKGALVAAGTVLEEIGDGLFRLTDEAKSPETIEFLYAVNGRTQMAVVSGEPYRRLEAV